MSKPVITGKEEKRIIKRANQIMSYLDAAGYANDGFGHPISRTGLKAIKYFLEGDYPGYRGSITHVRDKDLQETLKELEFAFP